jgi:nitrogen fixation protein NifU and related proteins
MASPFGTTILEHFKRPRNRGALAAPDVSQEGFNALCGDRVRMELALSADVVREARFTADACAISIAAASLLTERLRGLSLSDAEHIMAEELIAALGAEIPAARRACALLPLTTLQTGIQVYRAKG